MDQNFCPKIGIVVALNEEFSVLLDTLGFDINKLTFKPFKEFTIYELDYEINPSNKLNLIFLILNSMTNTVSAMGTQFLLNNYNLSCIINIGISGLCSDDFHLCDVIIGNSSNEYDSGTKIVDFSILHGGESFRTTNNLYDKLSQIEFIYPVFFKNGKIIHKKE